MRGYFVFGSQATGLTHPDSDIDVAIVSRQWRGTLADAHYLLHKAHQLGLTDVVIEPHGFHPRDFVTTHPIAWAVKTTGIRVK